MLFFDAVINSTNETNKAGGMHHSSVYYLDVYGEGSYGNETETPKLIDKILEVLHYLTLNKSRWCGRFY
jgi:hypothetical protein